MICLSIVSHGQRDLAARLLGCIAADRSPRVTRIVYTRNLPEPDLPADLSAIPGLEVIDNPRPRGFGANHNQAFGRCAEPYFCVLNPDLEWRGDPFAGLVSCLEGTDADPDPARRGDAPPMGLVAPLVKSPSGRIEATARTLYTPTEVISQKLDPRNVGASAHWLAGMFLLFRADAYRTIGGFDERYFLYIEDVDISTRLRLAGWSLRQCARVEVVHDARNHSHHSLRYAGWHAQGMLRYWMSPGFWRYRALLAADRRGPAAAARSGTP